MKKIKYIIFALLFLTIKVQALEILPENIYYYDNGLYAYLEADDIEYENLYIEYSMINGEEEKNTDLIEVTETSHKYELLKLDDDFLEDFLNLKIKARYAVCQDKCDYSEWSSLKSIKEFNLESLVAPEILDFNIDSEVKYKVVNENEINAYLKDYFKIYDSKIEYQEEYRVNDGEWLNKIGEVDLEDVKIDFRVSYHISKYDSPKSNILTYEKHPIKNMCLFGSDLCCNKLVGISFCLWILTIFILLVLILIYIDNKKRLIKEA